MANLSEPFGPASYVCSLFQRAVFLRFFNRKSCVFLGKEIVVICIIGESGNDKFEKFNHCVLPPCSC